MAEVVEDAWYLDSARAAAGWKVGAVGLRTLAAGSEELSAWGAMATEWGSSTVYRVLRGGILVYAGLYVLWGIFSAHNG